MSISHSSFHFRNEVINVIEMCSIEAYKTLLEIRVVFDQGIPEHMSGDIWSIRLLFYILFKFIIKIATRKTML
jgi:hypothetical protein